MEIYKQSSESHGQGRPVFRRVAPDIEKLEKGNISGDSRFEINYDRLLTRNAAKMTDEFIL